MNWDIGMEILFTRPFGLRKKRHILTQWERVFFPHVKPFRSGDSLVALKEWRAYVSPEEAG